ncbi:hypothetical protein [Bacillus sp. JCM 19041]|uniref:hypothetical protein n=1 Tax=Bacillus sp. JCM 19041 TaxID=1460637 RepID=UPI0006CF46AF
MYVGHEDKKEKASYNTRHYNSWSTKSFLREEALKKLLLLFITRIIISSGQSGNGAKSMIYEQMIIQDTTL